MRFLFLRYSVLGSVHLEFFFPACPTILGTTLIRLVETRRRRLVSIGGHRVLRTYVGK